MADTRFNVWAVGELLGSYSTPETAVDVAHRLVAGGQLDLVEVWPADTSADRYAVIRRDRSEVRIEVDPRLACAS